jgi:hypothetical protein
VDQYVYSVDNTLAETEFVAWFMRSPVYLERAPIETTPGQLPRIRTEEVASVQMNLPSLGKQWEIVARIERDFKSWRNMAEAAEAEIQAIDRLSAAFLRRAFSGDV